MTLQIELPEELSQFVRDQISKLGYRDASEYFQAVLEAEQRRKFRRELEQSLVEAVRSPSTPLTEADFEDIERKGMEIVEKRLAQ